MSHLVPSRLIEFLYRCFRATRSFLITKLFLLASTIDAWWHPSSRSPHPQIKFVTKQNGKRSLVFMGYRYTLNQKRGDLRYWECCYRRSRRKTCRSRIVTHINSIRSIRGTHDHSPFKDEETGKYDSASAGELGQMLPANMCLRGIENVKN